MVFPFDFFQDPHSLKVQGTDGWLKRITYPVWGQFLIVLVIAAAFLPTLIYLCMDLYKRPKVWKDGFKKRFTTTWIEYLPDPAWRDKSRLKSEAEMNRVVGISIRQSELERKKK